MIKKIHAFSVGGKTYASLAEAKSVALIEAYRGNTGDDDSPAADVISVAWMVQSAPQVIDILRLGTRKASSKAGRPRKRKGVLAQTAVVIEDGKIS